MLDPIAAIVIAELSDSTHGRHVNMPAENRSCTGILRITGDGLLEVADEIDRILDP